MSGSSSVLDKETLGNESTTPIAENTEYSDVTTTSPIVDNTEHSKVSTQLPIVDNIDYSQVATTPAGADNVEHSEVSSTFPIVDNMAHSQVATTPAGADNVEHSEVSTPLPIVENIEHSATPIVDNTDYSQVATASAGADDVEHSEVSSTFPIVENMEYSQVFTTSAGANNVEDSEVSTISPIVNSTEHSKLSTTSAGADTTKHSEVSTTLPPVDNTEHSKASIATAGADNPEHSDVSVKIPSFNNIDHSEVTTSSPLDENAKQSQVTTTFPNTEKTEQSSSLMTNPDVQGLSSVRMDSDTGINRLPSELRMKIFKLAMTANEREFEFTDGVGPFKPNVAVGLLGASRQIYHDARPYLYSENAFLFAGCGSELRSILDQHCLWSCKVNGCKTAPFRKVRIVLGDDVSAEIADLRLKTTKAALEGIRGCVSIKMLHIELRAFCWVYGHRPEELEKGLSRLNVEALGTYGAEYHWQEDLARLPRALGMNVSPEYLGSSNGLFECGYLPAQMPGQVEVLEEVV